jgi:rare lipoprotein A
MRLITESRVVYSATKHHSVASMRPVAPRLAKLLLVALAGVLVSNCAQQSVARRESTSKEVGAFPQAKYGTASQRVVAEGDNVPKGGGRELVGRPYTIAGKRYTPYVKPTGFTQVGLASWYGEAFHGRKTANGEIYDRHGVSAAHTTMPLPSYARVTNTLNGRSIIVRVNDRGPYHGNRIMDLSQKTADALAFRHLGVARVKIEYVGRASTGGSDDTKLLATLRTDGQPASLPGFTETPTQVARTSAPVPVPVPVRSAPSAVSDQDNETVPASTPVMQPVAPVSSSVETRTSAETRNTSSQPQSGQRFNGAPLPPQRPFDLETIPNAGIPVAVAVPGLQRPAIAPAQPARPQIAGLMFAPVSDAPQRFSSDHPVMRDVKPQKFVPLNSIR